LAGLSEVQREIGKQTYSRTQQDLSLNPAMRLFIIRLRALLDKAHTLNAEEGFEEVENDQDFEDIGMSTLMIPAERR
jgi:hypothetical protein